MRSFFTLIELIVVIAVLGILAAIIIPNISSFQEEANDTAITSNVRNLQSSVDMYGLENYGGVPTENPPKEDIPQPIDFNKIYPDYTRDIPEEEGVKYWVDFQGKVWASTIDSPSDVTYNPGELKWTGVENAAYYNIFKVVDNSTSSSIKNKKTIFIKKLEDNSQSIIDNTLPNLQNGEQYLVNAVDDKGFESAPAGTNYNGYVEVPFTGGEESQEPQQEALVPVGSVYTFTNASQTGRTGPSQSQLDATYSNTNLSGKVKSNNGIQQWTVPQGGTYRIGVYGASGGNTSYSNGNIGGNGAYLQGDFNLNSGETLNIVVGQQGENGGLNAGGGGGTFVWINGKNSPLIVAGGGSGAGSCSNQAGLNATTNTGNGYGGRTGLHSSTNYAGGGGAGWMSNGGAADDNVSSYPNAKSPIQGSSIQSPVGGVAYSNWQEPNGNGGFGGGGAGADNCGGGGGGGGYQGGKGGAWGTDIPEGGYSYNNGINKSGTSGANNGHGKVIITKVN